MTNDSVNLENFAFWLNNHLVNNFLCAKFGIFVATAATSFKPEEFSIENATMRNIKTFTPGYIKARAPRWEGKRKIGNGPKLCQLKFFTKPNLMGQNQQIANLPLTRIDPG